MKRLRIILFSIMLFIARISGNSQTLHITYEGFVADSARMQIQQNTRHILEKLWLYSHNKIKSLATTGLNPETEQQLTQLFAGGTIIPDTRQHLLVVETKTGYKVLGITNSIEASGTPVTVPHKHLLLKFNGKAEVTASYFTPEAHHFQDITNFGPPVTNTKILNSCYEFMNEMADLYEKKNLQKLKKIFEEDPLIITGQYRKQSEDQIRYRSYGLGTYLNRLKNLWEFADSLSVAYKDIQVKKHPYAQRIFAIQAHQKWASNVYTDEGYLLLVVDFFDPFQPVVHVRIWRPEPFF